MVDGDGSDDDGETERYEEVSQALPGLAVYGKSLLSRGYPYQRMGIYSIELSTEKEFPFSYLCITPFIIQRVTVSISSPFYHNNKRGLLCTTTPASSLVTRTISRFSYGHNTRQSGENTTLLQKSR